MNTPNTHPSLFRSRRNTALTAAATAAAVWLLATGPARSQTIGVNFSGLSLTDINALGSNLAPPDTDGAIGPNHFVEFINGGYAVFNRNGTLATSAVSDRTFWLNAGVSSTLVNQGLSDTRIKYDPLTQRWFAAEITVASTNTVLLGVSKTSNPLDGWNSTSFKVTGTTRFNDYPTLSVDANAVYIGSNDFNTAGTAFIGTTLSSIPKSSLLALAPTTAGIATFIQNTSAPTMGFTPQVPTNYGSGYTGSKIVSISATAYNQMQITPINNTGAAGATLSAAQTIGVAFDGDPTYARQPNGSRNIDTLDDRFSGTIYQVGSKIYGANAFNPAVQTGGATPTAAGNSAIHWIVLDAASSAVLQEGLITDGAHDLWQPSIAANANGDVVIGYNKSGTDMNISSFAAVGHTVGGVLSFTDQVLLATSAVNNYTDGFSTNPDRWGDFSATMVDPNDPFSFWTIQEVAVGTTTWGTQITQLILPVPEPATIIVGLLCFGAGLLRRRRSHDLCQRLERSERPGV